MVLFLPITVFDFMIKYDLNKQVAFRFPHLTVKKLFVRCQKIMKLSGEYQVSIVLVGESAIKKLNRIYRGKNKVTDVLSFGVNEKQGKQIFLGEIIVCVPQMKRQALQYSPSVNRELLWLLTHGFLHLLGFDHEKKSQAMEMEILEQKILND